MARADAVMVCSLLFVKKMPCIHLLILDHCIEIQAPREIYWGGTGPPGPLVPTALVVVEEHSYVESCSEWVLILSLGAGPPAWPSNDSDTSL